MPRALSFCFLALPLLALSGAGCAEEVEAVPVAAPPPPPARQVILVEAPGVVQPTSGGQVVVAQPAGLETWATRRADASRTLGAWVHENPEAAKSLFDFDAARPERCREFVRWALTDRVDDVSVFTSQHPDWSWFDNHASQFRLGMDRFVQWARSHPAAAQELVAQPGGLRWVGDHLYASEWRP